MARITGEVTIDAPVDEVFDFVADERNEPAFNPRMLRVEKLTDDPIGTGTRFAATVLSGRRPEDMIVEFTSFDRPHRLASRSATASAEIRGALTFAAVPEGTRLSWSWELRPKGFYRLLAPLIGPLGRRSERTVWTGLKRHLEGSGARATR